MCSILALIQLYPGTPTHYLLPSGRAIGTIGSPPFLGCMLLLALPVAALREPRHLLFLIPALLATRSRAAILAAAVGAFVLYLLRPKEAVEGEAPRWVSALFIAAPALLFIIALDRAASDTMRLYTWSVAWKAFLARPLLGWGPDNFIDAFTRLRTADWIEASGNGGYTVSENAHNIVLNILATQGIFGLAPRIVMLWKTTTAANAMAAWGSDAARALLAAGASVLVYSLLNPVPFMAWCVLSFLVGALGI